MNEHNPRLEALNFLLAYTFWTLLISWPLSEILKIEYWKAVAVAVLVR